MIKHINSGVPPCICFNTSLTDSANVLFASLLPSVLHLRCDINDHNSVSLYTQPNSQTRSNANCLAYSYV